MASSCSKIHCTTVKHCIAAQRANRHGQGTPDLLGNLGGTFQQDCRLGHSVSLNLSLHWQVKALRERNSVVKRKASIIINNMSKLVLNPADAAPFLPRLLPEVKKVRWRAGVSLNPKP